MNKRTRLLGAAAIPAVALAAVAIVLRTSSGSADPAQARHDAIAADAQQLTVTVGDSLSFDRPTLIVEAGRPVVVTVRNQSMTEHDFVIPSMPAQDVVVRFEGGHSHGDGTAIVGHPQTKGEVRVQFTPTEPGTYEFYCSLPGHREAGMTGTVTVL
jgi:uncharacterized cupredoxin-like copper-binding protein